MFDVGGVERERERERKREKEGGIGREAGPSKKKA